MAQYKVKYEVDVTAEDEEEALEEAMYWLKTRGRRDAVLIKTSDEDPAFD